VSLRRRQFFAGLESFSLSFELLTCRYISLCTLIDEYSASLSTSSAPQRVCEIELTLFELFEDNRGKNRGKSRRRAARRRRRQHSPRILLVLDELKEAFYRFGRRRRRNYGACSFCAHVDAAVASCFLVDGRLPIRKLPRVQVAAAKELGRRRLTKMLQRPRAAPTNSPSQLQSFITIATSASSDFVILTSAFATSVVAVATSAWNFISSTAPVPREVRRRVTSRRCRRRTRFSTEQLCASQTTASLLLSRSPLNAPRTRAF